MALTNCQIVQYVDLGAVPTDVPLSEHFAFNVQEIESNPVNHTETKHLIIKAEEGYHFPVCTHVPSDFPYDLLGESSCLYWNEDGIPLDELPTPAAPTQQTNILASEVVRKIIFKPGQFDAAQRVIAIKAFIEFKDVRLQDVDSWNNQGISNLYIDIDGFAS